MWWSSFNSKIVGLGSFFKEQQQMTDSAVVVLWNKFRNHKSLIYLEKKQTKKRNKKEMIDYLITLTRFCKSICTKLFSVNLLIYLLTKTNKTFTWKNFFFKSFLGSKMKSHEVLKRHVKGAFMKCLLNIFLKNSSTKATQLH